MGPMGTATNREGHIFRDFPPFRVLSGCAQVRLSALDALDSRESRAAGELQVFDVWRWEMETAGRREDFFVVRYVWIKKDVAGNNR